MIQSTEPHLTQNPANESPMCAHQSVAKALAPHLC
uniref:Uncharacterized protein n=1 Tax=Anguilla anguilla TaxID=7936 RepID=A0A0E9RC30_ANGAN